jgi:hypothetical protein
MNTIAGPPPANIEFTKAEQMVTIGLVLQPAYVSMHSQDEQKMNTADSGKRLQANLDGNASCSAACAKRPDRQQVHEKNGKCQCAITPKAR